MYIRNLPRSRPSKRRKRRRGWIRCPILDYAPVPPDACIALYLLDTRRRQTDQATSYNGEPIALAVDDTDRDLERAIGRYGSGWYRVMARDVRGRIVARRDVEASFSPNGLARTAQPQPRSRAERMASELDDARAQVTAAESAHREARARVAELERRLAERDAQVDALEAELDACTQRLERARRLYASRSARAESDDEAPAALQRPDPAQSSEAQADLTAVVERVGDVLLKFRRAVADDSSDDMTDD